MRSGGTRVRGSGVSQQVTNPVGDSNPCPRIGAIGDRQGRDARTGPRQEGPQTANSRRDSYCWGYRPKLPGEALAVAGPLKRPTPSQPHGSPGPNRPLAPPWQVSMNGNGPGRRLWNCLLDRTCWRHGDLTAATPKINPDRGMIELIDPPPAHRMEFWRRTGRPGPAQRAQPARGGRPGVYVRPWQWWRLGDSVMRTTSSASGRGSWSSWADSLA